MTQTFRTRLRLAGMIGAVVVIAFLLLSVSRTEPLRTTTALAAAQATTPTQPTTTSEIGSTDGIVVLGIFMVMIVLIPVVWYRVLWKRE